MKMLSFFLIAFLITGNTSGQTDTLTDTRDGNRYTTVVVANKRWFRENLRFSSKLSYYPNTSSDIQSVSLGNYYAHTELDSICPRGWHVSTIDDWEEYIQVLKTTRNLALDSMQYKGAPMNPFYVAVTIKDINLMQDGLLQLNPTGWVQGKRIANRKNLSLWTLDKKTNDDKYHAHISTPGYIIHSHTHNVIDKARKIRRFPVRCVCDLPVK
jgi:uncharacterized protein (TIGR02145 family)